MRTLSGPVHVRYLLGCVPLLRLARQGSVFSIKRFSFVSVSFEGGVCVCTFFFLASTRLV